MKLGTICYVPPTGKLHSGAFMENISKFPAFHPLYTLSDDACWSPSRHLTTSPESVGRRPAWALNNYLFFSALELARDVGLDYAIYMESDSRVGRKDWDTYMFEEFFGRYPNGIACAGTPVAWNVNSGGCEFAKEVIRQAWEYQQASGLPASFYSGKHPHDNSGGCYYPNGSLMIVQVTAMMQMFHGFWTDPANFSRRLTAFDMAIGNLLWNYHGPKAVEHVGWLACSYSGYGNAVTTEAERLAMLIKDKVAVHQVKGA